MIIIVIVIKIIKISKSALYMKSEGMTLICCSKKKNIAVYNCVNLNQLDWKNCGSQCIPMIVSVFYNIYSNWHYIIFSISNNTANKALT